MRQARLIIIGFACLLWFGGSESLAQHLEGGVKVGPSIAKLYFEPATAGSYGLFAPDRDEQLYRRRVSFGGGGFVVLPVSGPVAIQVEGLFTSKGARLFDS